MVRKEASCLDFTYEKALFRVRKADVTKFESSGLMLRCAADRQELPYTAVAGAIVNGKRPPKLPPRRYQSTFR
jgi:hypothetical protein